MGNISNWSQAVYKAYFEDRFLIKIQKPLKEVQLKQKKQMKMFKIISFTHDQFSFGNIHRKRNWFFFGDL